MADKFDVFGTKPLHHLNRFRLIVELRETRAELKRVKQQLKDVIGGLDAMNQADTAGTPAFKNSRRDAA